MRLRDQAEGLRSTSGFVGAEVKKKEEKDQDSSFFLFFPVFFRRRAPRVSPNPRVFVNPPGLPGSARPSPRALLNTDDTSRRETAKKSDQRSLRVSVYGRNLCVGSVRAML